MAINGGIEWWSRLDEPNVLILLLEHELMNVRSTKELDAASPAEYLQLFCLLIFPASAVFLKLMNVFLLHVSKQIDTMGVMWRVTFL